MGDSSPRYYQPTPLDFLLLEQLPEKGIIGGMHWAGKQAKHVRTAVVAKLPEGSTLGMNEVMARLRSMKVAGFVEDFQAVGGRIWALTEAGVAHLATKDEVLG